MRSWQRLVCGLLTAAYVTGAVPARAQTGSVNDQIRQLQQQIQEMQQRLQTLQNQVNESDARARKAQEDAVRAQAQAQAQPQAQPAPTPPAAEPASTAKVTMSPTNRPGICTADGANCIELTSRLNFDFADYLRVKPTAPGGVSNLQSGVNARRARIGVIGKFLNDWNYGLVFDFGGSTDSGSAGTNPGGVENAYISYTGLKPLAMELGYIDVPWTLEEAMSSNDILFLERASVGVVATNLGAGDFRSAAGARAFGDRYWAGAYLTGPQSGALHSGSNQQQLAGVARASYQFLQSDNATLHAGIDGMHVFEPRANGSSSTSVAETLTFSDRPELRVDPTQLLTTGAIPAKHADVYGAELAGTYGPFFAQGEYYHFSVDQAGFAATAPTPTLKFDGAYAEAAWVITGEHRPYMPSTGAYGGIRPEHPFSLTSSGWGAWEVAARWSYINLNNNVVTGVAPATSGGVGGGRQTVYTLGLNWYPLTNLRFMFDYIHADVAKPNAPAGAAPAGSTRIDAIAMRTQIAF
jgi:phosphate-selective porin OprO/OprP